MTMDEPIEQIAARVLFAKADDLRLRTVGRFEAVALSYVADLLEADACRELAKIGLAPKRESLS